MSSILRKITYIMLALVALVTISTKPSFGGEKPNSFTDIISQSPLYQWLDKEDVGKVDIDNLPEFKNKPFVYVNNGDPHIDPELKPVTFEKYSSLDHLKRCGVAEAVLGKETMPTEERQPIGMIKPSGWHTVKYDCVNGKYLYNRCHLIGFQLSAENANEKNLITGTRYLNVDGMLPFENMVADYIKETNNHVYYKVTPVFVEDELVCRGVIMEAYSIEDNGAGISFNVYCFNNQPGIEINYATGDSKLINS